MAVSALILPSLKFCANFFTSATQCSTSSVCIALKARRKFVGDQSPDDQVGVRTLDVRVLNSSAMMAENSSNRILRL